MTPEEQLVFEYPIVKGPELLGMMMSLVSDDGRCRPTVFFTYIDGAVDIPKPHKRIMHVYIESLSRDSYQREKWIFTGVEVMDGIVRPNDRIEGEISMLTRTGTMRVILIP